MAHLILQRIDGSTETRELSRSHSLTIGRQKFNDICVPENEVNPLHCRISWNKSKFEVTSATSNGIDVNSATVAYHELKPGDVIRVGSLDLIFEDDQKVRSPATESSPPRKLRVKTETKAKAVEDLSAFEGPVMTESEAVFKALLDVDPNDEAVETTTTEKPIERKSAEKPEVKRSTVATVDHVSWRVRPGEQEIIKSPLVLGLIAGGVVLLLLTGIFWLWLGRENANRLYEQAVSEMNGGQYTQSIASFERFIQQYPGHGSRRQADRGLEKANVLKEISGASPAWNRGLERLNDLIKRHRNESDFSDLHSTLFQFADEISLGAAKSAETVRDPELLAVSKEAQSLLERYADPSTPLDSNLGRISEQQKKAERAIEKQKTFDIAMKTVEDAITNKKPMVALAERERLVKSFPDFANSKRVKEALVKALDLERSVVAVDDTERVAETTEVIPPVNSSILSFLHTRSRSDESSQGKIVFAVAKDSCYAIDATSGEIVWRRVIGTNSPFFPAANTAARSSVLIYDGQKQALLSCDVADGKLVWRQSLAGRPLGKPLIHEGQIYLPIDGNYLVRLDVDTGRLTATVRFSQNLATTPALSRDGDYLLVPGVMAMIYSLSLRSTSTRQSLSAAATTFTDHAAGSVSAPPLSMGKLLLICENDQADSAKLRLWNAEKPTEPLVELATSRTAGQVRDEPVLRGNQLVVPSAGEQFAAFIVTDEVGREGIAPIGQYRADQTQSGKLSNLPVFVALGSDNQFWSASSAFRRFEIGSDNIRMDSNSSAAGIASQPLQSIGDFFYVGRKSRFSDAVTFSAIEREKLVNPWRCIVGDTPREMLTSRDGNMIWVGESGTLYSLGKNRIETGGIELKAGTDLDLPNNISSPIRATILHDQRMTVFAAGDTKQLLVLNSSGQVVGKHVLADSLEADPLLLDEGLVLPLPKRLKLLNLMQGKKNTQDWLAPAGDAPEAKWAHLIRVDGNELIACDDRGHMIRVQFRQANVPYLAEVAKLQLDHPVDVRPVLRGDFLYVADAGGSCRQLNVHSFDVDGQRTFSAPIKNIWSIASHTLLQAGDQKLHCLDDGKDLPERWTFDLAKLEPTGAAHVKDDAIWLGCRNGTILVLNLKNGTEIKRIQLPQSLSLGLRKFNEKLIAIALDGTIYRVE